MSADPDAERFEFTVPDGRFDALILRPERRPAPGLLILPEVFGRSAELQGMAGDFAARGFLVGVVDLHWRLEPEVALGPTEIERARSLHQRLDYEAAAGDVSAAVEQFRGAPGGSGKVAVVGFCLGGTLAWIAAARSRADACVAYYGTRIPQYIAEAHAISRPLLMHIGEADHFTPPEVVSQIEAATADNPDVTRFLYPGVGHSFCNPAQSHFDPAARDAAHRRTEAFLNLHLSSAP